MKSIVEIMLRRESKDRPDWAEMEYNIKKNKKPTMDESKVVSTNLALGTNSVISHNSVVVTSNNHPTEKVGGIPSA